MSTDQPSATPETHSALDRALTLGYGIVCYVAFFTTFLYLIGFVGGVVVPKDINSGATGPTFASMAINVLLIGLFAVQHTIMARPGFKQWWTRIIPAPVERSTFVLITSLLLVLLCWQWRPLPTVIWDVRGPAALVIYAISGIGWVIVLLSTLIIDHFDLFGLKQTYLHAAGREYAGPQFRERFFYRFVRHPLMTGFLVAFWFTAYMTVGHLLLAVVFTVYVLLALRIEEKTLVELHGEAYEDYRRRVPNKLFPFTRKG